MLAVARGNKETTYWTSVYMTAFGTMSIIVRLTMLKYDVISSSMCVSIPPENEYDQAY